MSEENKPDAKTEIKATVTPAGATAPTGITEDEANRRVQAALDAEREKTRKQAEKDREEAERKKQEEQGQFKELADKAEQKRQAAEEKAAAAERRAQLAEVNVQLRDYLANPDNKLDAYLANAPDVMLHVERKLAADAKPEDVAKLIAAEAKAFAERTPKNAKVGAPAPVSRTGPKPGTITPRTNGERRPSAGVASARF